MHFFPCVKQVAHALLPSTANIVRKKLFALYFNGKTNYQRSIPRSTKERSERIQVRRCKYEDVIEEMKR